jgi:hypothetical protein
LPAKHRRLVAELHDDVSHSRCVYSPELNDDARAPVAVCSPAPNERPETVTEYPPDIAKFGCSVLEVTVASKLKIGLPVPDTDAIVIVAELNMSANKLEWHCNAVADVHDDVKHTPRSPAPPRSSPAVAVCSPSPKLRPERVTEAYPLFGTLRRASDTTAASKLKIGCPVPATEATVTLPAPKRSANAFEKHFSVVDDVQDDVRQSPRSPLPPRSSPAVAVWSVTPKFSPDTVTEA